MLKRSMLKSLLLSHDLMEKVTQLFHVIWEENHFRQWIQIGII